MLIDRSSRLSPWPRRSIALAARKTNPSFDPRGRATRSIGRLFLMLILLLCFGWVGGCEGKIEVNDQDIEPVTYRQVKDMLAEREKRRVVLIDVRQPEAFDADHIPGAVNIPLAEIRRHDSRLAQAKTLVVYSKGWRDRLSLAAAKKLVALGYQNVRDYRGGLEDWQDRQAGRESAEFPLAP